MDKIVETLKALAEETRLQIVTILHDRGELCVCDFVGSLGLTQSKASRHLRYLYHAGLVNFTRDGLWMHYRLSPELSLEQKLIIEAAVQALGLEQRRLLQTKLDQWLAQKEPRRAADEEKNDSR